MSLLIRFGPRSSRRQLRPCGFDTLPLNRALEIRQPLRIIPDAPRRAVRLDRVRREASRGLANVPFHRMQAIAAIRDVGHAEVLAGRQEVLDAARNQRAEWNLKWQRADV